MVLTFTQKEVIVGSSRTEKEPDVILLYLGWPLFWVVFVLWVRLIPITKWAVVIYVWPVCSIALSSLRGQNSCHQVKWMWKTSGPQWRQRWLSRWLFLLASPSQSLMLLLLLLSSPHWWEELWSSILRRTRTWMRSQCQVMAEVLIRTWCADGFSTWEQMFSAFAGNGSALVRLLQEETFRLELISSYSEEELRSFLTQCSIPWEPSDTKVMANLPTYTSLLSGAVCHCLSLNCTCQLR